MNFLKKLNSIAMVTMLMSLFFVASYAFADESVVAPQDFLAQVLDAIKSFGGLSTLLKITCFITLIVSSMKVSFLNDLVWSKLGAAKAYLAPILGLIAGILGIGSGGAPITLALVFAYMSAGAGAVFLHEILDSVKAIPGLGSVYVTIIGIIESALGGPAATEKK